MDEAEATCRAVYGETAAFYAAHRAEISPADLGYRVLYGPPTVRAPVLFVGYQPGGRAVEDESHHRGWPAECDYATAGWPLARRIQALWGPVVAGCTGLNAVFFRAPSVRDWRRLDRKATALAEAFSVERAERIVRVLAPRSLVVIGLATFDMLVRDGNVALGNGRRILAKTGELWGAPATGVIHLSGARIGRSDLDRLRSFCAGD